MVYCRLNNYFTFITREKNPLLFYLLFLLLLSEEGLSPESCLAVAIRGPFAYNRSSRRRCSFKKGVLRNFAKFTGKHLCQRNLMNRRCSVKNFRNMHSKTPVLESVLLKRVNFIILESILLKRDSNTVVFLTILQNF